MERSKAVFTEVSQLYLAESAKDMGKWMWHNHVQWVANKANGLAEKYGANAEKAYCAALIHDLGDCQHLRSDATFGSWSEEKGEDILMRAGFNQNEAKEIISDIVRPHSCRPGNLPTTLEGKVLATADAMWHLQTNFYPLFCYKQLPENTNIYEEWQEWFNEKIDRDFGTKIFFEDERAEVNDDYKALSRVFRNTALRSKLS
jgi:hypothetical protein